MSNDVVATERLDRTHVKDTVTGLWNRRRLKDADAEHPLYYDDETRRWKVLDLSAACEGASKCLAG